METLGGRNNRKEGTEWRLYDGGLKSTFTIYESKYAEGWKVKSIMTRLLRAAVALTLVLHTRR